MGRGGKRVGAGRPPGTGKYGEPTTAMRLPISLAEQLQEVLATWDRSRFEAIVPQLQRLRQRSGQQRGEDSPRLPLYSHAVAAGFPSPATDEIEEELDLNAYLTTHPEASFCVRAMGDSMIEAGIQAADLLLVDTVPEPEDGDIVIAVVNGELTVKRLRCEGDRLALVPENPEYPILWLTEAIEFYILGRVTHVIHAL
ncbi:MAG: translesion error-prone DNA polymerase V autoproteolytic subunit [Sodalinema sp.]|uniref:LexA family protein n=1 Tax=Sodalinema sp. TaxID=3080550 RepID=UPI0012124948|nr:MAG: translesion error-prone DNA polymerase V autoproteolytic subunit [Phormidium sp. SL48-SHIP]